MSALCRSKVDSPAAGSPSVIGFLPAYYVQDVVIPSPFAKQPRRGFSNKFGSERLTTRRKSNGK